jgi:hypothetical protein
MALLASETLTRRKSAAAAIPRLTLCQRTWQGRWNKLTALLGIVALFGAVSDVQPAEPELRHRLLVAEYGNTVNRLVEIAPDGVGVGTSASKHHSHF